MDGVPGVKTRLIHGRVVNVVGSLLDRELDCPSCFGQLYLFEMKRRLEWQRWIVRCYQCTLFFQIWEKAEEVAA